MSDLTKGTVPAPVRVEFLHPQTRQAGVEIAAGDALYIDSGGKLQKAVTTQWFVTGSGGEVAFDGLAARNIPSGTYGEIYGRGTEFFYANSGLTIGGAVWCSNTAGKLADAQVAAALTDKPVAKVISATNILLVRGV